MLRLVGYLTFDYKKRTRAQYCSLHDTDFDCVPNSDFVTAPNA